MIDACDPPLREDVSDDAQPDGGAWRAFIERILGERILGERILGPLVPA